MANPHRGDVSIVLSDKTYTLRPKFQVLAELENQTGLGLVELASRFIAKRYGLNLATAVVTAGLKGAGEPATHEKVGEMITETGLVNVAPAIIEFLTAGLTGGEKPKPGEGEAAGGQ